MNKLKNLPFGLLFFVFSTSVYSLGPIGHKVVGKIAENHLSTTATEAITKILVTESLANAATWPDTMRNSKINPKFWSYSAANSWHFVNVDANDTYEHSTKSEVGDAYVALNTFIAILKNDPLPKGPVKIALNSYFGDSSDPYKQQKIKEFAVKFIIHIIGDMHQPLHAGHSADFGGNTILVKWLNSRKKYNLHKVWDSGLIKANNLTYQQIVSKIDKASNEKIAAFQNAKPIDWLHEAISMRQDIYDLSAYKDNRLSASYVEKYLPVIEQQMLKAGLRAAAVFNDIFTE